MDYSLENALLVIVDDEGYKREGGFDWFTEYEGISKQNVVLVSSNWEEGVTNALGRATEEGLVPVFLLDEELDGIPYGTQLCQSILEQKMSSLILPGSASTRSQQERWKKEISEETIQKSNSLVVWEYTQPFGFKRGGEISKMLESSLKKLDRLENQEKSEFRNK